MDKELKVIYCDIDIGIEVKAIEIKLRSKDEQETNKDANGKYYISSNNIDIYTRNDNRKSISKTKIIMIEKQDKYVMDLKEIFI